MYRNDKCRRCDISCSSSPTKCVECDLACYCSSKCQADDRWRHEVDCKVARLVRDCSGCGVRKVAMQQCGNCLEVWYCSGACQKRHWPRHKHECLRISQEIVELSNALNAELWSNRYSIPFDYYWGNITAVDLINLSLNEGSGYASPMSLLLCRIGDPRNVALSLASLPESYQEQLTFVLNDISACILARAVLLLYMLWKGGEQAAPTVTQVWYSLRITDRVHSLLTSALQQLIQATSLEELTCGLMGATDEHFKTLKRVWQTWLELSSTGTWITEEWHRVFARDPEAQTGIENYLSAIPSEHKSSAKEWFDNSILLPTKLRNKAKRENVTLTGSCGFTDHGADDEDDDKFTYCLPSDSLPFTSWDYKDAKAFHNVPSLLEMYSEYVSHVLAKCASRLVSGKVKVHCILSNCLEMQPFIPDDLTFDRVLTSNLCDYIPLPTLLGMCKPLLNKANPSSVIVTESNNWIEHFPEIQRMMEMGLSLGVQKALQDTGNQAIATSNCRTSFIEYYDLNHQFQKFVRAALLLSEINDLTQGKRTPSLKALALKHGLTLRDYLRNGNRIFPFRWAINCRRVTQLHGFERAVEWVLPADK